MTETRGSRGTTRLTGRLHPPASGRRDAAGRRREQTRLVAAAGRVLALRPPPARVRTARRIAAAAAYGGGGLTVLWATGVGVLLGQAVAARRRIETRMPSTPVPDGRYWPAERAGETTRDSTRRVRRRERGGDGDGTGAEAAPLCLVMLGDSAAAGQGAESPAGTPGAQLARGLATLAGRPVDLHIAARPGAVSVELYGQVDRLAADGVRPDAACIVVGANDVTRRVRAETSVRALSDAVARLRSAGAEVVVGTCPDLGTVRPVAQPLRSLGRRWSRRLAAAQTIAVVMAGGRVVSIGDLLGPLFEAEPDVMFAADEFHPSAHAYERAAESMLPSVAAALGILPVSWEDATADDEVVRIDVVAGVGDAAVVAAEHPGTEVTATSVDGHARGPRGRWVRLVRRPRARMSPD